jgi:chemotaxis protein CheX
MSQLMVEPTQDDVQALVEEVWASFLGTDEPLVVLPVDDGAGPETGWSAAVTVTGAWEGVVSIALPTGTAEDVCRRMLGVEDTQDEDVADAVGELVNMIGGNIKSLMPGPSVLSLPVVAAGRVARASDTREVCRLDAWWADAPLQVSVHVHDPQPRG